jgi:type III secretion system YscD/HrpQ family protein
MNENSMNDGSTDTNKEAAQEPLGELSSGEEPEPAVAENREPLSEEEHGSEAAEEHGSEAAEEHGSEAAEEHGSEVAEEHGSEAAEEHGSEAAKEHGSEAAKEHGSEAAEEHGSEAAKEHGSEAAEEHGSEAAEEHGSEAAEEHGSEVAEEEVVEEDSLFDEQLSAGDLPAFHHMDLELTESGRWLLKVVSGPNNGAEFVLRAATTYLLGTDPNICDVVFHDTSVSRQHARLVVSSDEVFTIEDLKSRNGTLVDAEPLTERLVLEPNILVTLGSTSFVLIDREGQMQTIISPFLPSIVKLLQQKQSGEVEAQEEAQLRRAAAAQQALASAVAAEPIAPAAVPAHKEPKMGMILLTAIIAGVVAVAGIAIAALFTSSDSVVITKRDVSENIDAILKKFPAVRFSFNKNTGKLLLVGHVLTAVDRHQLLYDLQELPEVSIDDKAVVVDEYVWQEANQILARTPMWRGISIHAAAPGKFVLSGYLQTHEQSEKLYDYISSNFPYLDLLDKQVVIEEDVVSSVSSTLRKHGFGDIKVQMQDGELSLAGGVPQARRGEFQELMNGFAKIQGVRDVKNMAFNLAPEQSMVDVSDRYEVTGFSQSNGKMSVVIGRRALYEGDILDGMRVEKISPTTVMLDKDGIKYRINYSS